MFFKSHRILPYSIISSLLVDFVCLSIMWDECDTKDMLEGLNGIETMPLHRILRLWDLVAD